MIDRETEQAMQLLRRKGYAVIPQASADMKLFGEHFPNTAIYDKSAKCYRPAVEPAT